MDWAGDEQSAVLEVVASGEAAAAVGAHVAALVDAQVAGRLAAQDVTLWGSAHRVAVTGRLGWSDLSEVSRDLLQRLEELAPAPTAAAPRSLAEVVFAVRDPFAVLSVGNLVPAAGNGTDVDTLLDEAIIVADLLAEDTEANPALVLAASIAGTSPLRTTVVLVDEGGAVSGLLRWVVRLLEGATGLTVSVAGPQDAGSWGEDVLVVRLLPATGERSDGASSMNDPACPTQVTVTGPAGSQILLWQVAAAVAARLLGRSPFGSPQPDEPARVRPIAPAGPSPAPAEGTEDE